MRRTSQITRLLISGWLLVLAAGSTVSAQAQAQDDAISVELFEKLLREMRDKYVEPVDEQELIQWGIEGILRRLDPYTDFYDASRIGQLQSITTGEYGGVGLYIDQQDGNIVVLSPIENSPSAEAGILPGDVIRSVAGRFIADIPLDRVISLIKGEIGSSVRITLERAGEPDLLDFELVRRTIVIKDIPYYALIDPGLGYIRLSHFSQKAPAELERALVDLLNEGMESLILDLRGNPGGLLSSAVEIAELFVKEGSTIVSTRGRQSSYQVVYRSQNTPVFPDGALVVLVDGVSASASEIVSGAIQDLDRGVLVGSRTFGKGLVQSIIYTDGGSALKLTTMRYYTPDGRSIDGRQALIQRESDQLLYNDGGGERQGPEEDNEPGLLPDAIVDDTQASPLILDLLRRGMFTRFAIQYLREHPSRGVIKADDEICNNFRRFLDEEEYALYADVDASLDTLEYLAGRDQFAPPFFQELEDVRNQLHRMGRLALDGAQTDISYHVTEALNWVAGGERMRIASILDKDPAIRRARDILQNSATYKMLLKPNRATAVSSAPKQQD